MEGPLTLVKNTDLLFLQINKSFDWCISRVTPKLWKSGESNKMAGGMSAMLSYLNSILLACIEHFSQFPPIVPILLATCVK